MKLEICIAIAMNLFGGKGDLAKDILGGGGGSRGMMRKITLVSRMLEGIAPPLFSHKGAKCVKRGLELMG